MSAFIPRPNSKYSTTLAGAITDTTTTTFQVNAVPARVPCILIIDPGTAKQEKLKCTAKGVSSITVVRNFDGAHADTHDVGASIVDYNSPEYITAIADVIENNFNSDNTATPKVKTAILDENGNELIKSPATPSAVNEVTARNAATGNAPSVEASGDDTNIDLAVKGKGSGKVKLGSAGLKVPNSDGTNGQVIQTDGVGNLSFTSIGSFNSAFSAYPSAGLYSIPNNTWTKVQFNTEVYDIGSEFDNATNYRFTAANTGKYHISANVQMSGLVSGNIFEVAIYKNGSAYKQSGFQSANNATIYAQVSTDIDLTAGDYIEIFVRQASGGALNVNGGSAVSYVTGHRFA